MSHHPEVNILLVDDRSENLLALQAILEGSGYRLVKAHSAEEALKALLTDDFAVILLDVQMPGLNGFETAKLIKQRERSKYIPIIFLTAISKEDQYVFEGYSVGAVDYMFKPFHPDLLRSKVAVFADLFKKNQMLLQEREARAGIEAGHRYLSFLVDLSTLLASTLEYERMLERIAHFAVPKFADACMIDMVESGTVRGVSVAHADPAKEAFIRLLQRRSPFDPDSPSGTAKVLRTGTPELYREGPASLAKRENHDAAYLKMMQELGAKSIMVLPISVQERTFGAMTLLSAESGRIYSTEDLAMMHELARRAAFTIDHARLYREAQEEIMERKRVEEVLKQKTIEAQEASRVKSEFVSNVSHELRTPLNAILGYTHLVLDGAYGDLQSDLKVPLEGVLRNADDLVNLVNGVLDLAKIESGKLSVSLEEVNLSSLIQEVLSGMKPLFREKSLRVHFNEINTLHVIWSDREKIRQILVNLLSNAVKFTMEGGVTITAESFPKTEEIEVSIQDTGIGIQRDDLSKIFNAFHQVDATSTREFGGVGLGLAIVKELVELLKGEITIESEYGKGTTATLSLPYQFE
jgi:signal transduction histidine kinase/CheY-like chemotaxis protein